MALKDIKLNHETDELDRTFGISEGRLAELVNLINEILGRVGRISQVLEEIIQNETLTEAEIIFITFNVGRINGLSTQIAVKVQNPSVLEPSTRVH